ncbi:Nodulation protein NolNO [Crenothrix polyspora]|uniref:Nodulation protein NolNO n=1 Tax=Crenothrix polyspora TaxID=360316 RepID=A0A1R4H2T3_9GAMM|nr:carbamoyltransferase C-terminal domain-containing protein [Crenothrix polyspora]SJM90486.1 Nodulation protein NolNO [Crenothrix polyspora]
MSKYYIGLSVTYHDSALAIIDEHGEVLFAEATERYLQNKRALNCEPDQLFRLPELLTQYCPNPTQIVIATNWRKKRPLYESLVSSLGFLSAPGLLKKGIKKLCSPLQNYQLHHMMACQRSSIESAGLNLVRILQEYYPYCTVTFADYDHHLTHAATACYSSPFEQAACAVIDSYGEHGAMGFYRYSNRKLERIHETRGIATASLGLYYMKITELCGFDWLKGEEWKVMGLASYGQLNQAFYDALAATIQIDGFGCRHVSGNAFEKLAKLDDFKQHPDNPIALAADLAFTGQVFFSDTVTRLLTHLHSVTGLDNLALAGGCALNSSYNGQISTRTAFKQVHIPSAPADDGCALGAAWLAFHNHHLHPDRPAKLLSPYLGSMIEDEAIQRFIQYNGALNIQHLPDSICQATAALLAQGKLVAWVQGRAEFGPRALGNRSILADSRHASMQDHINRNVKFREKFRPFAPSVLHEHAADYFDNYHESPYMDKTLHIHDDMQTRVAAVCHVDGTGRLQTVKREWNSRFYDLIEQFYQLTQVPMLLNTSFNVMGKPLIHTLEDALAVFLTTGLDVLVINDYLITKPQYESTQPSV